jgi:hypothetical protein
MNIKLCYHRDSGRLKQYVEKLQLMNITPILDDEIIQFNGKTLNVTIYEQLRNRDKTNPQVIEFKKRLMQIQMEKIKNSDGLLVLNEFEMIDLPSSFFYEIFTANAFGRPVILLNYLPRNTFAFDELTALNIDFLNSSDNFELIETIYKEHKTTKLIDKVKKDFTRKEIESKMTKKLKLKTHS